MSSGMRLLALVGDAPRELRRRIARDERPGLAVFQVEEVRPVPAADLQDVAEPLRRDQRRARALALCDRVDDDGRPVHE